MALRRRRDEVTKEAEISGQWLVSSGQCGSSGRNLHFYRYGTVAD